MVEPNGHYDAGLDSVAYILKRAAVPREQWELRKRKVRGRGIVALANCCPGEHCDRHQLSGSADSPGGRECNRQGHSALQSAVLYATVCLPVFIRIHVCRWRETGRRPRNKTWIHSHHGVLVSCVCQPCAGCEFCNADG